MHLKSNLIFKIVFCLVVLFTADRVFGFFMNYQVRHLKNGGLFELKYKLVDANPLVVILGSSRACHHYNTTILQNRFNGKIINYGEDGSDIVYYYVVLAQLLKEGKKPQHVIVDIRPNEFGASPYLNVVAGLYPISGEMSLEGNELGKIAPYENIKLHLYSYRFNNHVFDLIGATHGPLEDTGTITGYKPLPPRQYTMYNGTESNFELHDDMVYYLKAIVGLCKSHNIKLTVCTSPYNANIVRDRSIEATEEICMKNGIQYLNYLNNGLLGLPSRFFVDEAHLDTNGADMFTSDFMARIK